ncbi:quinone-dependent dihydroorotate dehydrogenase [Ferviditalea candida]|uniref:Dihydroorotate dehydrogenase (quinone) n=1 Tax=Ferviditalea candida TaxID=3108399 RepID=A0ABU5ZE89_9BACL|nr:quinone-dependent dihydroorotate dehydrogenase [Paenibacillaceae bacterium T2]
MLYRSLAKPLLFRMDPEKAHHLTVGGLAAAARIPGATGLLNLLYGTAKAPELAVNLWGIRFSHPIGLAAGLDKNGVAVPGFTSMGFSFVEVGTVTPQPQPGNELPRLFRLPEDQALINRMGFNNRGASAMAEELKRVKQRKIPVAVNIGKNKWTPNEEAVEDYRACIKALYPYGDFFVVNISSPNTPNLRDLQHGEELRKLLGAVKDEMDKQAQGKGVKPVLVKLAPDVDERDLEHMTDSIMRSGVSGIIATNTTILRDGLASPHQRETGGLSGKPLARRSTEAIRSIYKLTGGKLPIIGSGGIFSAQDAYEKIRAGASLVEVYTGLIYQGPGIVRAIHRGLIERLKRDGFAGISEAVGVDVQLS